MRQVLPLILLISICSYTTKSIAQSSTSWKKLKKTANQLFDAGKYAEAAEQFEAAYQKHPQSEELIYQAGESYYYLKDFKNASRTYKEVKEQNDKYELVGLKYARSLKQDGQYEAAKREFIYFQTAYQGDDKGIINQIVGMEVKGCDWAMQLAKEPKASNIEVRHLNEKINSLQTEFAPIPFAEDLLYFSSTKKDDKAYLFRSQKQKGTWSKAVEAENLPNLPDKHLANGSFAPDASRFYFTLCNASSKGSGLKSVCEIHVIKRNNGIWSAPIRLREYINEAGATTTQPWIVHQDGKEILYFTSNRKGGKGGMDIWYTVRDLGSEDIDFTYPVNLGKQVNTRGDEITPFYDSQEGALYFSSNGHISLGGWDIFKINGSEKKWDLPENLGPPINSSADDFYYVLKPSRKSGFLVSNRLAGPEKVSTQHEDIFEFGAAIKQQQLYVNGQVLAKESTANLNNVSVALYEIVGNTQRLLQRKISSANKYQFPVLPNKRFRLVVEKEGYLKSSYDFNTLSAKSDINYDFYLNDYKENIANVSTSTTQTTSTTAQSNYSASTAKIDHSVVTTRPSTTQVNTTTIRPNRASGTVSVSSTRTAQGTYYKVQLIAVVRYNNRHSRYQDVKNLAQIETENIPEKGLTRVLLANFSSKEEAMSAMQQAQGYGFADAFMVKYRDGQRLGTVWK